MTFNFHTDPGHGWVEVPLNLLDSVIEREKISGYSYKDESYAYLEEDCDAARFINAFEAAHGTTPPCVFTTVHTNGESFVRSLPSIHD